MIGMYTKSRLAGPSNLLSSLGEGRWNWVFFAEVRSTCDYVLLNGGIVWFFLQISGDGVGRRPAGEPHLVV
jgi:hypothetical protein